MAPKSLRICHVNVRSLCAPARLLDLEILTANHFVDILCLTETWLTSSKSSSSILIPGFQTPFRRDRPNRPGGGVAVYVRNGLSASLLNLPPNVSIESLCLCIHTSKRKKLNVIATYRPPGPASQCFFSELDHLIDHVQQQKSTPSV